MKTAKRSAKQPVKRGAKPGLSLVKKSIATARTLMTADPEVTTAESHVIDAAAKMSELDLRHLPVVDPDGKLVGMVSDRDVRAAIGNPADAIRSGSLSEREDLRVEAVMAPDPVRVELDATARDIAEVIAMEKIGAVPVVDENDRVVGIVSYVDLLAWYANQP